MKNRPDFYPIFCGFMVHLLRTTSVILDDVVFCFQCKSIYIPKERSSEELMMRGVNGKFENELKKLRARGVVVHGTAILRQEASYLGFAKDAPPAISICKVKISKSSEEPPVLIEGAWDENEDSAFNRYLKEHPSWSSIQSVEVDLD